MIVYNPFIINNSNSLYHTSEITEKHSFLARLQLRRKKNVNLREKYKGTKFPNESNFVARSQISMFRF